jgi:hypothetical protein
MAPGSCADALCLVLAWTRGEDGVWLLRHVILHTALGVRGSRSTRCRRRSSSPLPREPPLDPQLHEYAVFEREARAVCSRRGGVQAPANRYSWSSGNRLEPALPTRRLVDLPR